MSSQSQKGGKAISPFLSDQVKYSSTDVNCFESTKVFPFSGSDQHLIVSHFYSRGVCNEPTSHQLVVART